MAPSRACCRCCAVTPPRDRAEVRDSPEPEPVALANPEKPIDNSGAWELCPPRCTASYLDARTLLAIKSTGYKQLKADSR